MIEEVVEVVVEHHAEAEEVEPKVAQRQSSYVFHGLKLDCV